jgi:hypothetical protein
MSEAIRTGGKDGIRLDEYNGGYSLVSLREGTDGKFREQWATYQLGKDKHAEKDWPVKVPLGSDRETAIGVLRTLLAELGAGDEHGNVQDADDAPF